MKAKLMLICLVMLILTSSFERNSEVKKSDSVETYIEQLKSNQYKLKYLPSFTYQDIPALLEYRNETQFITKFPYNPVSSFWQHGCPLGMYVLWTIESIRVAINDQCCFLPSQNPVLSLRDYDGVKMVFDNASHETAAKAYYDWWKNHERQDFNTFKDIDPLQDTKYMWH